MGKTVIVTILIILLLSSCGMSIESEQKDSNVDNDVIYQDSENLQGDASDILADDIEHGLLLEIGVPDEELSLMQKVLLNKVEFYGMIPSQKSEPGWYKIEDLKGIYGEDDTFGNINLDRIGKKEVFVYYATGDAMIFHEEDNIVYGYPHTYNGFFDVGLNGSFWGICGWDDFFHYNISFDKHEMRYDYVWLEHDYPTQTNRFWRGEAIKSGYYGDSKIEITEAQFNEIVSTNEDEQLLNLHVFSVENILKYVE